MIEISNNDNYKAEDDIKAFHRWLIGNTAKAASNLNNVRRDADLKAQEDFKDAVDGLTMFYFYKFDKAGIDKPEVLKNQETPPDMTSMGLKDCERVFFEIMRVQDSLGHTTFENIRRGRREI